MRELDRRCDLAEAEVEAILGTRRIVDDVHVLDAHVLDGDLEHCAYSHSAVPPASESFCNFVSY